mgnify:CR=1 FL=1
MTVLSAAQPTLIGRLWPQTAGNSMARAAALILIGSALMAIAAHIQVPFWPVKLSMQSFVAIVIGTDRVATRAAQADLPRKRAREAPRRPTTR